MGRSPKKAAFLASLGGCLEYYDFIIYGMMAGTLSTLFFNGDESWVSLLKSLGVFAVGYIARPFGGILFGMLGDARGRKKVFTSIMFLMAASTFAIGLLPTYGKVGAWAPCLLVLLRVLQGISFGAELPGAITIVSEYAGKGKKSIYSGFVISAASVGSILASFVLYALTKGFDQSQILSGAWRIPFLLGGLLAGVNYFIRRDLEETPEFARSKTGLFKEPLLSLARDLRKEALLGIGMTLCSASLVIFCLYLPIYLGTHFAFSPSEIYLAMICGMVWSALSVPLCALLADRTSYAKMFIASCALFAALAFPLFSLLSVGGAWPLIAFMVLYQTTISCLAASYFAILPSLFPTSVRYTGVSFCYNAAYSIMGCAPLVITALIQWTNSPASAIWALIGVALTSGFSCFLLLGRKENYTEKKETQRTQSFFARAKK